MGACCVYPDEYRPRQPKSTPLFRLLDTHYEELELEVVFLTVVVCAFAISDRRDEGGAGLNAQNDVDVLKCPKCGGRMKVISFIEQPSIGTENRFWELLLKC